MYRVSRRSRLQRVYEQVSYDYIMAQDWVSRGETMAWLRSNYPVMHFMMITNYLSPDDYINGQHTSTMHDGTTIALPNRKRSGTLCERFDRYCRCRT